MLCALHTVQGLQAVQCCVFNLPQYTNILTGLLPLLSIHLPPSPSHPPPTFLTTLFPPPLPRLTSPVFLSPHPSFMLLEKSPPFLCCRILFSRFLDLLSELCSPTSSLSHPSYQSHPPPHSLIHCINLASTTPLSHLLQHSHIHFLSCTPPRCLFHLLTLSSTSPPSLPPPPFSAPYPHL